MFAILLMCLHAMHTHKTPNEFQELINHMKFSKVRSLKTFIASFSFSIMYSNLELFLKEKMQENGKKSKNLSLMLH